MANRIKGITVEIGGDTTGLDKALKSVNKSIRESESALKDVNKLLKLDPSNTELLSQKQKILRQEIEQTETKLSALKEADKQAKKQLESGDLGQDKYDALQREIVETEEKLKSLKDTTGSASSTLASVSAKTGEFGSKAKDLGQKLLPVTAAVTGIGAASASMAMDFDDAMSQAAGALDKPIDQMDELRHLAIQTGQDTIFSATDAGNAITELAKGGLTEAQIEAGALQATMDLAASSGMELGDAANVVVQAMGAFGLSASDAAQSANALAGAAAASSTDVEPLTQGLSQCSAMAHNAGWSIQETTAALGMFADAGIVGSDAGTSLKTMLQRLAAPTDTAAAEMESLGLNVRDSQGNMLGATEIAQQLQDKLGGLDAATRDAALQTIFGSDATRAATVMMNNGADGIQKYISATTDQTSAQRMANSQMSDTSRAIEEMKGSLETAAISIGTTLSPIIQDLANFISNLADKFSNLPGGVQKFIVAIAGIAAAVGPVLIVIGQISTGISSITGAFSKLSTITKIIGPIKTALSGLFSFISANPVVLVISAVIAALVLLYTKCEWFRDGVNTIINAVIGFFKQLPENISAFFESIKEKFQNLKDSISTVFDNIKNAISNAWNAILNNPVVQSIVNTVSGLFTNMKDTLSGIWDGIKEYASGAWELIKNVVLGPVLAIIDLVTGDFDQLKSDLENIWNNIKEAFSKIWNGIKTVFTSIVSGIVNNGKTIFNGLKNTVTSIFNSIKTTISNVFNSIKNTVSKIASSIKNGFQSAIDFITSLPEKAKKWGKDFIDGLVSGIKSMIGKVTDAVSSVGDKIRSFLHFSRPDEGPLRDYETWMPDFIDGLAKGIERGRSVIQSAVKKLSGDMSLNINAGALKSHAGGTTEVNFYGSYTFGSKNDIDYFMNQAALKVASAR